MCQTQKYQPLKNAIFCQIQAAAAKSLQSCLTLCDLIDGSPPGFAIPGILQARTLEWVTISFSNAWMWSCSVVSDCSQPHGLHPTRLRPPWDFPGKSTGVGCHCLLWQLCAWNWKPLNQQVPGSHSEAVPTGEAGGRPQRCMLSGYLEKCSEPRASGHFRAASLGSQVAHCLWLIASLNNHTVPCWGLCFSWVYPLLSTDSPRASAFKSINAPKVVFFFLFFSLFVLFIYL